MHTSGEITQLLEKWGEGAESSFEKLMSLVYDELHNTALHHFASEPPDHTLQPTALINETYLRLKSRNDLRFKSRSHFYAYASHVMRNILLDHARKRTRVKRGGGRTDLPIHDAECITEFADYDQIITLDRALNRLHALDARKSRFLEQFYFAGLNAEEMAEAADLTPSTVRRELRAARHWLAFELGKNRT